MSTRTTLVDTVVIAVEGRTIKTLDGAYRVDRQAMLFDKAGYCIDKEAIMYLPCLVGYRIRLRVLVNSFKAQHIQVDKVRVKRP